MEREHRIRLVGGLLASALEILAEELPDKKSGDVHVLQVRDKGTVRSSNRPKKYNVKQKPKKQYKFTAAQRKNMSIAAKNRIANRKQQESETESQQAA